MRVQRAVHGLRAEDERLLDVGGARRSGDPIHRAGHGAGAKALAQLVPQRLVIAGDVAGLDHDDVRVGQEIQRRRIVLAGDEHQRPGFGDRPERVGDRRQIAATRRTLLDFERALPRPRHRFEPRVRAPAQRHRQIVRAQERRHGPRHVGGARDFLDRSGRRLDHLAKQLGARLRRKPAARGHDASRMLAQPIRDRLAARRLAARHAERAPDRGQDGVARGHGLIPPRAACALDLSPPNPGVPGFGPL